MPNSKKKKKDDHKKLKELIIYVSDKCQGHSKFGATKLNKILFFADFIAYSRFGKSITGETYFKLPKGPAPKKLVPVRKQLIAEKALVIVPRETMLKPQQRPTPLRDADLSLFEPREIALVDSIIETLKDKRAEEVSELSHYYIGWQITSEQSDIPYETVFLRNPKKVIVTEKHRRKARELAKQHGL